MNGELAGPVGWVIAIIWMLFMLAILGLLAGSWVRKDNSSDSN